MNSACKNTILLAVLSSSGCVRPCDVPPREVVPSDPSTFDAVPQRIRWQLLPRAARAAPSPPGPTRYPPPRAAHYRLSQ